MFAAPLTAMPCFLRSTARLAPSMLTAALLMRYPYCTAAGGRTSTTVGTLRRLGWGVVRLTQQGTLQLLPSCAGGSGGRAKRGGAQQTVR